MRALTSGWPGAKSPTSVWVSCWGCQLCRWTVVRARPVGLQGRPPRSSERMTTEQGGLHCEPKAKLSEPTQAALLGAQWAE